ncbi:hypothetical protein D3C84_699150 [compost metagenome]
MGSAPDGRGLFMLEVPVSCLPPPSKGESPVTKASAAARPACMVFFAMPTSMSTGSAKTVWPEPGLKMFFTPDTPAAIPRSMISLPSVMLLEVMFTAWVRTPLSSAAR